MNDHAAHFRNGHKVQMEPHEDFEYPEFDSVTPRQAAQVLTSALILKIYKACTSFILNGEVCGAGIGRRAIILSMLLENPEFTSQLSAAAFLETSQSTICREMKRIEPELKNELRKILGS